MISKSKIDKIGEKIKRRQELSKTEGAILLTWRNSFFNTLEAYHRRVREKIDMETVISVGKRIKRIPSIHTKLKNSDSLRLSTMQDIAGLRVVLKNQVSLYEAVSIIRSSKTKNILKKVNDYHSVPKENGYRSTHLIFLSVKDDRLIEIQFRTELEHIWATAVEVYGTIQLTSFKTGEGGEDWKEFFKLLSSYFAIYESSPVLESHKNDSFAAISSRLKKYINKLKVIEVLAASTKGIDTVVKSHSRGKLGRFALIELDTKKEVTSIEVFNKNEVSEAIRLYTLRELEIQNDSSKNLVFANIESVESLQLAYPNYFLDTDKLLKILGKIRLGQKIIG
ncbi:MAG: hypothetical protein KDD50_09120 [Bdellovibrionales bacterium]|nr:hypothetical protein [Bdellovibrionales bacterium]